MKLREIQKSNIPALFAVRIATWHNDRGAEELEAMGITPESVKEMMDSYHRSWLCETDDGVVGFAMGNKETGEMRVIEVLKEYIEL